MNFKYIVIYLFCAVSCNQKNSDYELLTNYVEKFNVEMKSNDTLKFVFFSPQFCTSCSHTFLEKLNEENVYVFMDLATYRKLNDIYIPNLFIDSTDDLEHLKFHQLGIGKITVLNENIVNAQYYDLTNAYNL